MVYKSSLRRSDGKHGVHNPSSTSVRRENNLLSRYAFSERAELEDAFIKSIFRSGRKKCWRRGRAIQVAGGVGPQWNRLCHALVEHPRPGKPARLPLNMRTIKKLLGTRSPFSRLICRGDGTYPLSFRCFVHYYFFRSLSRCCCDAVPIGQRIMCILIGRLTTSYEYVTPVADNGNV